jgi:hypothetical protein
VGEEHLLQAHPRLGVPQGTQCVPAFRGGKSPTLFLCHLTTCVILMLVFSSFFLFSVS